MKKIVIYLKSMLRSARPLLCTVLCAGLLLPQSAPIVQEPSDLSELPLPDSQIAGISSVLTDELAYDYPETDRPGVYAGHEVLVIVPHQDDEVCILGGVFERYIAEGSRVRVLFTTNGDYVGGNSAETRMQEAINAMAVAGIPAEDVYFLGFGDQWHTSHIYHQDDDTVLASHSGNKETYSTKTHDVWQEGVAYTRANYKACLRDLIETIQADTIFCIDFDGHQDHRALSLLFEEVMGEMLRDNPSYTPTVFKGFGYSLSWAADFDFYEENILSTVNPYDVPYMTEVNYYNWADRVRFPIAREALGRLKAPTTTYQMLVAYASQEAPGQGNRVLNGDRVFWHRPTESVLYRASFAAASGSTDVLNDFRYTDCVDVTNFYAAFAGHVWIPDVSDTDKCVEVALEEPSVLTEIRLFDNPSLEDNILKAEITLSDGSVHTVETLPTNGSAAIVPITSAEPVESFTVRILESEGAAAGLTEIEAYKETPDHGIRYIKLMNESDDFVYDYWIDLSGSERFTLHGSNIAVDTAAEDFILTAEGDDSCSAVFDGNDILVTCPAGRSFTLTVQSKDDPTMSDAVRISNPSSAWRFTVDMLQRYERIAGKLLPPL